MTWHTALIGTGQGNNLERETRDHGHKLRVRARSSSHTSLTVKSLIKDPTPASVAPSAALLHRGEEKLHKAGLV